MSNPDGTGGTPVTFPAVPNLPTLDVQPQSDGTVTAVAAGTAAVVRGALNIGSPAANK